MTDYQSSIRRLFHNRAAYAVLVIFLSGHAHADLALTFDSVISIQPNSDSKSPPTVRTSQMTVLLGETYFHFTDAEEERIYDFETKTIYSINRNMGIYSAMSLYANIGFRDYEIKNRIYINGVFEHAGLDNNPSPLVFSEHELSVKPKDSNSDIKREVRNEHIVFLGEGKEMLVIGGSVIRIPETYQKPFIRFYRHQFGGHPTIINEIVTSSGIYEDITISHINIRLKKVNLHLESAKVIPAANYSLEGLEIHSEANTRLLNLVDRIGDSPINERKASQDRILANASDLIARNDLVGGMLAYLEYMLVTGLHDIPWSETDRERLLDSDEVKEMLAATQNPTNRENAASTIKALEAIRKKQTEGNHVLKIFEANTRSAMGESKVARDFMMDALEKNPYIAGAWKDLGGFYFQSLEPYEAWICWDTARKINPSHPLLDSVTDFENRLQTENPGLF